MACSCIHHSSRRYLADWRTILVSLILRVISSMYHHSVCCHRIAGLAVGFYGTMIVALYLALAMRSKSVKEAGSVLTPITLAMIMPILLTQFINLDDVEMFWFGVPFVNVLLGLRELLLNRIIIEHVIVWILVSSLICLLTVRYAAKQFHREDIITTKS